MVSRKKRIDRVYRSARVIPFGAASSIVVMSDCHRGIGSWADDFTKNQTIYLAALKYYDRLGYTYIELGDGDELWENKRLEDIYAAHGDVFAALRRFKKGNRLYLVVGNHDIVKLKNPACPSVGAGQEKATIQSDITFYEGLVLKDKVTAGEIFLLHGHQADVLNDTLWRLSRFLVRYVWQPLELLGVHDPTSAAKNNKVKATVERHLKHWAETENKLLIAGHTHRPVFSDAPGGRYFNDGCCVHLFNITAIEITDGSIVLVKWGEKTQEDGTVYIGRDIIAGPVKLKAYFQ
ncbi:metallophosphoesterase [Oscillospiraceae bacterium WX1]